MQQKQWMLYAYEYIGEEYQILLDFFLKSTDKTVNKLVDYRTF